MLLNTNLRWKCSYELNKYTYKLLKKFLKEVIFYKATKTHSGRNTNFLLLYIASLWGKEGETPLKILEGHDSAVQAWMNSLHRMNSVKSSVKSTTAALRKSSH